jgi:GTP pyrophosphokinase
VATPKGNLYRSIHTAVTGPGGKAVEVQIRTREMHEQAELGLAAHWRYKEGSGRDARFEEKILWARRLLEPTRSDPQAGADADADGLDVLRGSLFADRLYVFTPKGDVIDLPRGATALDFAYHVHTSLGHRCRGAKANGRIIALDTPLTNGDVVDIIAGRSGGPSRDWLNPEAGFLASARSRAKVRAWFHQQDVAATPPASQEAAHAASTPSATPAAPPPAPPLRARPAPRRKSRALVLIEGVDDLPSTLARCCGPVPPLAIAGYVTLGRGVTVHRTECASLARMQTQKPDRVLRARWNLDSDDRMPVRIRVQAYERRNLLRDVTDQIALAGLPLDGLDTRTNAAERTTTLTLDTAVRDHAQLEALLKALLRLPEVLGAHRVVD